MTKPVRLFPGDFGSFVGSAVVEPCMEETGPTGVVDVPIKLFPDTAAVSSGVDGIC